MGISIGSNFDLGAALALDSRTIRAQQSDLSSIANPYNGLETFTTNDNKKYRYQSDAWVEVFSGTPQDGILDWQTDKYAPYATQGAGKLDISSSIPVHDTRLNYDGYLYSTKFYAGNSYFGFGYNYDNDGGLYNIDDYPIAAYDNASDAFYYAGGVIVSLNNMDVRFSVPIQDISGGLYWSIATTGINVLGHSSTWGAHGAGGVNVYQEETTNATWLITGSSGGTKRGGIQLLDSGAAMRLYASSNYLEVNTTGITYGATAVSMDGHTHAESTITFTDITTKNASTDMHGYLPKLDGGTDKFLRGDGSWVTLSAMVYPGSGIANSTGTAWGTSYTTTGSGTVVALATSPSITTSLVTASTTFSLLNTTATTINFAGAATTLNIGLASYGLTYTGTTASYAQSTGDFILNLGSGATTTGNIKTINIGVNGASGSTTNIYLGSSASTSITTIYGTLKVTDSVKLLESGSTPTYYTALKSADLTADITYIFAATVPVGNTGYFLMCDLSGNFSWADPNDYTAYYFTTNNATPFNTSVGYTYAMQDSTYNVLIGYQSQCIGDYNVIIGANAGNAEGVTMDGSVIIGYGAGAWASTTISNKLIIANSNTTTPLIQGDFSTGLTTLVRPTITLSFSYTGKHANISAYGMFGRREGKVNVITGYFTTNANSGTSTHYQFCRITTNFVAPYSTVYFACNKWGGNAGTGALDTDGNIKVAWYETGTYHFTIVYITD